jgi:hypothetical protein
LSEINNIEVPIGIHTWIAGCPLEGEETKDDIKIEIQAKLELAFKMINNFNLESLIKELNIDLGGITINNNADINNVNNLNLTYNNLKLILDKLIEATKPPKNKRVKLRLSKIIRF